MANEFNIEAAFDKVTVFTMLPAKGEKGDPGQDGQSAYIIAREHGFPGTEAEWEQLMTETYQNAQTAADAAVEARRVSADVQAIVDQGLGPYYYDKGEIDEMVGNLSTAVSRKANASDVYTQNQMQGILGVNYYTKNTVDSMAGAKADISDVNSLFTVVTASSTYSASTGAATTGTIALDNIPDGYSAIGIIGVTLTNSNTTLRSFSLTDSTTATIVSRHIGSTGSTYSLTATVSVLCVKTIT